MMKKEEKVKKDEKEERDDIEYTEENYSSLEKIKKMRQILRECQKEKEENLNGWQRAKADLINSRRIMEEDIKRASLKGKEKLLFSLLPSLDSFSFAQNNKEWETLPEEWRKGIEKAFSQLQKGLQEQGIESFGKEGDVFDPLFYECVSVLSSSDKEKDNSIATLLQKGYRLKESVIRPAKVIVYQCENTE
jgi:molecular chaperone GrpE